MNNTQISDYIIMASRSMDDEKKSQSNQNGSELAKVARLSILIDATGAMSSLLAVCKITIQQTVSKLKSFIAKSKTTIQIFALSFVIICPNFNEIFYQLTIFLFWLAAYISIHSLYEYFRAYKNYIK